MIKSTHIEYNDLYLSKRYLKQFVSTKALEKWNRNPNVIITKIEDCLFYLYKSIPFRTRKKLPAESKIISEETKNSYYTIIHEALKNAKYFDHAKYKNIYTDYGGIPENRLTEFCQLHAVYQTILDLKYNDGIKKMQIFHEVFKDLFPGKINTYHSFINAISKAAKEGVLSVALDKKVFGNNLRENKEATPQIDYVMAMLTACEAKLSKREIMQKANGYFKENGIKEYSESQFKSWIREWNKNTEVYKMRYGKNQLQKLLPTASLINSNQIHIQWQVDGMTMPFWEDKYHRSVLVIVVDNCSKKIIGYSIGYTENSEVIKNAIRNAVNNTGVLPFELVMDNHSATQTKAFENFESLLNKVGSIFTTTSNPRQKIIIERVVIQALNKLFKNYYGYLGQSIKSKSIEARPSDEQTNEFAKQFKNHNEVIAIATEVVELYNDTLQKGLSPNQSFNNNQHPHPIALNQFNKAELLSNQITKQIRSGQITIQRGVEKFEYQLPAKHFQKWNNQIVIVRHDDLRDGIYLFDKLTGEGIVFLRQKDKINNAKAIQTTDDISKLYKHKGRLKGITTIARNQLTDLRDKALNIDPEAYLKVNALTTPKDIKKQLEQDANLKMLAENNGAVASNLIETNMVYKVPASLQPQKKDTNPFTSKGNKLEIIDPLNDAEANDID